MILVMHGLHLIPPMCCTHPEQVSCESHHHILLLARRVRGPHLSISMPCAVKHSLQVILRDASVELPSSRRVTENFIKIRGNEATSLRSRRQSTDVDEVATQLHVYTPTEDKKD